MGKYKIRFVAIAFVAIMMTLFSQGTLAYYQTIGKSTNVVTTGDIELKIHEKTDAGTDFPKDGVYVLPGDIVSKQVSIENVGGHPFYLRVKLLTGTEAEGLSSEDCLKLNIDETKWTLKDGWYYFNGIVEPGTITPNIFSHVEIVGSKVDSSYIGHTLTLTVSAHAVQSENNPIQNNDYSTASGWPAETEAAQ